MYFSKVYLNLVTTVIWNWEFHSEMCKLSKQFFFLSCCLIFSFFWEKGLKCTKFLLNLILTSKYVAVVFFHCRKLFSDTFLTPDMFAWWFNWSCSLNCFFRFSTQLGVSLKLQKSIYFIKRQHQYLHVRERQKRNVNIVLSFYFLSAL